MTMNFLNNESKKAAALLSYAKLFCYTLNSIFLVPILLRWLGEDDYGLYQMIYSVGHYILILDFGIGTVMMRYISEYRAKGDDIASSNFSAMIGFVVVALCLCVMVVGFCVDINLENIYSNLSQRDYELSHKMFQLMVLQILCTFVINYYTGIVGAYDKFVFVNFINVLQVVVAFFLTIALLLFGMGTMGVVVANLIVTLLVMLATINYTHRTLGLKIKFYHWDKIVVKPVLGLMAAMCLQSIVMYVNTTIDKTVLGIMCSKRDVAIYSIAATIITFFNAIPTAISGLFQPTVMRMIVNNASTLELTDLVVKVGRWQFVLVGAIICGLCLFGMDLISLWVGGDMYDAILIALIILPFNMIPLVQTICLSILNGYDKRLYRSVILVLAAIIKVSVTIALIKIIGPWGAPIGTAFAYLIGHCIALNLYYKNNIKLQVGRMFREIFARTWFCLLVATLVCSPLILWTDYNLLSFLVKGTVFFTVLCLMMWVKGFNTEEKSILAPFLKKIKIFNLNDAI